MEENNSVKSGVLDENDIRTMRENRRRSGKEEEKKDYLTKMIFTQLVVCAVLVLILFAFSKLSSSSFAEIKEEYDKINQTDMSVQEVWKDIKSAAAFVFLKTDSKSVSAQSEEITSDKVKETENETTTESETKEEATEESTGESDVKEAGKGGDDIAVFASTSSTLFSPFITSSSVCVPVNGEISSGFGYRVNPVTGDWSFHTGLDIAASSGEKIKAAYYGTVEETGYDDTSGNYVLLRHSDKLVTKYMHCSEIKVKEGTVVRQGETIALVGSTGRSTGPHLHFVIEVDGKKVNPLYVLEMNDGKV